MIVKAVDPANVAMVLATIEAEAFERYELDKEVVVGVDVARLFDVCKIFNKDLVEMSIDGGKLTLQSGSIRYSTSLIDPAAIRKEPKTPELGLRAEVVMDAKEFKKAIAAVEKISDEVVFDKTDVGFRIVGEGSDESIVYSVDNSELVDANTAEAEARYSIDYMKEFAKAGEGKLTIRFDTNYPCWLTFELKEGFRLEYILAPRIPSEG